MSQSIDVYAGWIVAFVDGQWRHVYVPAPYCTIADHWEPNEHLGLYKRADVDRAEGTIKGEALEISRYVVVGPQVTDEDVLLRIAFVRFGRVASQIHEERLVDGMLYWEINRDLDDSQGVNPGWPQFDPPDMPKRWTRTSRSLVIS